MNPLEKLILVMMKRDMRKLFTMEESLTEDPRAIHAVEDSPERAWPDLQWFTSGTQIPSKLSTQLGVMKNFLKAGASAKTSLKDVAKNPRPRLEAVDQVELVQIAGYAKSIGVDLIGFTALPQNLIFKNRAVFYYSAIVLCVELGKEAVAAAPSFTTYKESIVSYDRLGAATNKVADKLKSYGYQAQASHPLGGLVLYPPLAAKAGLGVLGLHGLLITPEFGPRQRISVVFTDAKNLPFVDVGYNENPSCSSCRRCAAACPAEAFRETPIYHPSGRKTSIVSEKCTAYFAAENACSICMRECALVNPGWNIGFERPDAPYVPLSESRPSG
ncbi:MAG: hypothetical protein FWD45_06960 [Coriobacteriia bacterium]|nr:hypothetical protein [Coriobacteriia bacterium]